MASTLTDTQGIVALAAGAVAVVALLGCVALAFEMRRVRRAQRLVLGEQGQRDLVAHAATMQEAFESLQGYVEDIAARLDGRLAGAELALRGAIAHRALVRYDAYNELSGRQSMSIALLDAEQSGIVISCIHHRDQARVYGKQVYAGQGELELSPEEAEAVRLALAPPAREDGA
jgi:Protein of unknown function (DUF4446)